LFCRIFHREVVCVSKLGSRCFQDARCIRRKRNDSTRRIMGYMTMLSRSLGMLHTVLYKCFELRDRVDIDVCPREADKSSSRCRRKGMIRFLVNHAHIADCLEVSVMIAMNNASWHDKRRLWGNAVHSRRTLLPLPRPTG
jgi:hypothetical protein